MEQNFQNTEQEKAVIDYLKKMEASLGNYEALYLNVKSLPEKYQTIQVRKTVQDCFVPLLQDGTVKFFVLPNNDIIFILKKELHDIGGSSLVKLKFLFHEDPKIQNASSLEECGVAIWYDLMMAYTDFVKKVSLAYESVKEKKNNETVESVLKESVSFFDTSEHKGKYPLTTEMLSKIQKIISVSDFSSFIRRQAICAVIGKSSPQRIFEEVFVSIPDLRDSLLPDVDITSNPWLFLSLTETLDRRVLELISRHDDGSLAGNFSVNINVSTILSDDFLRFDDSINGAMRQTIVLELQLTDIFSDIRSFILAKTFAKTRGYKLCIDGITYDKLKYLNRSGLDCDLMKIVWHPELIKIFTEDTHFMDYVNKAERAKIIFCRIDDAEAIKQGNALGINLYQGRYIQNLLNSSGQKR